MLLHGTHLADRVITFFELSNTIPELKRQLFIRLQILGMFLLVFVLALTPRAELTWFDGFVNGLLILLFAFATWLLWQRRERQELVLLSVFFGTAIYLFATAFSNLSSSGVQAFQEGLVPLVAPWFIGFVLLHMACFLTFRAHTALRVSLLITILFALIVLFAVVQLKPPDMTALRDLILLVVANAVVLLLAFPLAEAQEQNSETDFLTGLANRTRGYAALVSELERAKRYNTNFAIILFDIDYFKKINDTYGHPSGDVILREVAAYIQQRTRRTDLLCRWGGEEFLLLMTYTDLASARLKAEHMRQQLKNRAFHKTIYLTASFGVTMFYPFDSTGSMLERADRALYLAKRNGRNAVVAE